MQDARQRVADGGQTSLPWRLSRSVIDSVGLAGTEFARIAEYALVEAIVGREGGRAQISRFGGGRFQPGQRSRSRSTAARAQPTQCCAWPGRKLWSCAADSAPGRRSRPGASAGRPL